MTTLLAVVGTVTMPSACGVPGTATPAQTSGAPRTIAIWHLRADNTSSRTWTYVDGQPAPGGPFGVEARGTLTLGLNARFVGGPVQLRFELDGQSKKPTAAFAPAPFATAFSFTFIGTPAYKPCPHTLGLLWRSPTGKTVRLTAGYGIVSYKPQAQPSGAICS